MIAVDTNILVYAHRHDSPFHREALAVLVGLAEGSQRWAIPWPCIHEFLAVTTGPGVFRPPSTPAEALAAIGDWLASPVCEPIGEGPGYFERLRGQVLDGKAAGPQIHDARIAAICLHNGVNELWTADRDFSRYRRLRCVNPLVGPRR